MPLQRLQGEINHEGRTVNEECEKSKLKEKNMQKVLERKLRTGKISGHKLVPSFYSLKKTETS